MRDEIVRLLRNNGLEPTLIDNVSTEITGASLLASSRAGHVTYAEGPSEESLNAKAGILAICGRDISPTNERISYILVDEPKVAFYYSTHLFGSNSDLNIDLAKSRLFAGSTIGQNCQIGTGVTIHPGVVIRENTIVGDDAVIEAGCVVGSTGLLWTWDTINNKRVMMNLTGGTEIESNVYLCSNISIVRGACNDLTRIGHSTMVAPGSAIGHGSAIGPNCHLANNVTLGGGVKIGENCFLGSNACIQPGVAIAANSVIGSSATLTKDALVAGVYIDTPARRIGAVTRGIRGLPTTAHMDLS